MAQTAAPATASKKPSYRIKSITVSVEIADKEYGNGNSADTTITAYVDDASLAQIDDVVDAGLDMFVAGWETVLAGKVATKLLGMKGQEFQEVVPKIRKRLTQVKSMLRAVREIQQ